mmetsp:Transcript_60437/g.128101  ORF Transcript_60437/g.128101 Transcript_60437/m.128101 type:complete len:210 (-) Transcript_60437:42-671(-)
MEDLEMQGHQQQARLPQSEAIMEAIIKSSKPLSINGGGQETDPCSQSSRWLQRIWDRLVPWHRTRWLTWALLAVAFVARIVIIWRHLFCAYIWAIYALQQALLFVTPAMDDDELEASSTSEYRLFVRALGEFPLWQRLFISTNIGLLVTLFEFLDLEVDGQALVFYFVILFAFNMRQQIQHMVKYRYVPWTTSKKASHQNAKKSAAYDV